MRKVLLIVYDMIPYASNWGGSQRMYYLAKKLISEGCSVEVVALNKASYNTCGHDVLPQVTHIASDIWIERDNLSLFGRAMKRLSYRLSPKINALLYNEIFPMTGFLATYKINKAKEIIRRKLNDNDFDAVIISGPPFTLFSLIPYVKRHNSRAKIVMDYRDPWNSWYEGSWYTEKIEKKYQNMADIIVCTNEALCKDMSTKYGIDIQKYKVSANGFIPTNNIDIESNLLPVNKFNIVYTGDINLEKSKRNYRSTECLLKAIKQLASENIDGICITFVGIRESNKQIADSFKEELGDLVNFVGRVSSAKAQNYVAQADACLVLHTSEDNSGKFLVSGKVYDYIQGRRFILSIARPDSLHARIVENNRIGYNSCNDVVAIKEMIMKSYKNWQQGELLHSYDSIDITPYSRDYQLNIYYNLIKEVVGV